MALIPIFFKADDINNVKKGHLRSQDLASFLSLMTLKKVGILDMLGSNPCGLKTDISVSSNFATITLNAGYISILGRLIYIEDGTTVEITLPNETQTGSFGIRVNLSESGSAECSWFTKTGNLQTDNIVDNPTGIYEFRLYDYTATANSLTFTNKTVEKIPHLETFMNSESFATLPLDTTSNLGFIATTEYVHRLLDRDVNIDEDSIMFGSDAVGNIFRRGDFVFGEVKTLWVNIEKGYSSEKTLFTFDRRFAPKSNTPVITGWIIDYKTASDNGTGFCRAIRDIYITPNGEIKATLINTSNKDYEVTLGFNFGYNKNN